MYMYFSRGLAESRVGSRGLVSGCLVCRGSCLIYWFFERYCWVLEVCSMWLPRYMECMVEHVQRRACLRGVLC